MTDVLQCPHCVLRFSTQSELDHHKAFDHPNTVDEPSEEAAPPVPETEPAQERPQPESEQKGGWFKRLFGGG